MLSRRSTGWSDEAQHEQGVLRFAAPTMMNGPHEADRISALLSNYATVPGMQTDAGTATAGPLVSTQAMAIWKAHLNKLSPLQKKMFLDHQKGDLTEYVSSIEDLCRKQGNQSRGRRVARLFRPLFRTMNMYAPVAQTMIQADPTSSALILGGITCIMSISDRYLEYQEKIVEILADMEEKLGVLVDYGSNIYQDNDSVQGALMEVFGDILEFCSKAWQMFRDKDGQPRSSLHQFVKSLGSSFEMQFGAILKKFEKDLQTFADRAQLCDRRETKDFRSLQVQFMKHQLVDSMQLRAAMVSIGQQQVSLHTSERQIGMTHAHEMKAIESLIRKQEHDKEQGMFPSSTPA